MKSTPSAVRYYPDLLKSQAAALDAQLGLKGTLACCMHEHDCRGAHLCWPWHLHLPRCCPAAAPPPASRPLQTWSAHTTTDQRHPSSAAGTLCGVQGMACAVHRCCIQLQPFSSRTELTSCTHSMAMVKQDVPAAGLVQLCSMHKQSKPSMVHSHCITNWERQAASDHTHLCPDDCTGWPRRRVLECWHREGHVAHGVLDRPSFPRIIRLIKLAATTGPGTCDAAALKSRPQDPPSAVQQNSLGQVMAHAGATRLHAF